jgi:hypothetical protein
MLSQDRQLLVAFRCTAPIANLSVRWTLVFPTANPPLFVENIIANTRTFWQLSTILPEYFGCMQAELHEEFLLTLLLLFEWMMQGGSTVIEVPSSKLGGARSRAE